MPEENAHLHPVFQGIFAALIPPSQIATHDPADNSGGDSDGVPPEFVDNDPDGDHL